MIKNLGPGKKPLLNLALHMGWTVDSRRHHSRALMTQRQKNDVCGVWNLKNDSLSRAGTKIWLIFT